MVTFLELLLYAKMPPQDDESLSAKFTLQVSRCHTATPAAAGGRLAKSVDSRAQLAAAQFSDKIKFTLASLLSLARSFSQRSPLGGRSLAPAAACRANNNTLQQSGLHSDAGCSSNTFVHTRALLASSKVLQQPADQKKSTEDTMVRITIIYIIFPRQNEVMKLLWRLLACSIICCFFLHFTRCFRGRLRRTIFPRALFEAPSQADSKSILNQSGRESVFPGLTTHGVIVPPRFPLRLATTTTASSRLPRPRPVDCLATGADLLMTCNVRAQLRKSVLMGSPAYDRCVPLLLLLLLLVYRFQG